MQHLQEDTFRSWMEPLQQMWGIGGEGLTQKCLPSKEKLWDHGILAWDPFCLLYEVLWKL